MKESILKNLPENFLWQDRIFCYPSVDSTNLRAKELAAAGAPEGTVVIADQQSAGRGRLGRSFHSPAGSGIYLSLILRPEQSPAQLMHLTCAVGVAVCDAIEEVCGLRPGIKWINDLVIDGRKLGGILVELAMDPITGKVAYAIVGIGLNCSQKTGDFPPELSDIATSLRQITGKEPDRPRLAAAMVKHLEIMRRNLEEKAAIMERYRCDCVTLGKEVTVFRGNNARRGTALDIDPDGGLLVRYSDSGTTEIVNSGEVSVRGLFGYT